MEEEAPKVPTERPTTVTPALRRMGAAPAQAE